MNNKNSAEQLQQQIQELQNTLEHLQLSCNDIKTDIKRKGTELVSLNKSQADTVNSRKATGKKDRYKKYLSVGDRVKVLTKSTPTAAFFGVKEAKIVRFDRDWIYLISLDQEKPKSGKRIAYNLRKIE